jgi:dihydrofolate reductase
VGDSDWKGWWGDVPPYHCPVFVLTHYAHDPIEMQGGTTFHFVSDRIESAYAQAKAAAGERAISIAGGASCARQAIEAGLVDEIDLQVNPVILGSGERLLDCFEAGKPTLELVRVLEAPGWPTCATASSDDSVRAAIGASQYNQGQISGK